jgi:hypothetical protein
MASDDLRAARRDLDALRDALDLRSSGVDTPLGHALIAVAGAVTLTWVALTPPSLHHWGLLSVLLPCSYVVGLRVAHRDAAEGSPAVRRDFREAIRVLALGVPLVAYTFWAQHFGVPPLIVLATTVFFVGVMMLGGSWQQPAFAYWGLTLMAGALVLPLQLASPVAVIAAMLVMAGGLGAALSMLGAAR